MAINSRKKGSRNERHLSKLWKQFTGKDFSRTPSSGGLRWHKKSDTAGDIICTDEKHARWFAFSIETKFYKEINFNHLLLDVKSDILKFWEQATNDAKRAKKIPILFMKYNGMPKQSYFICLRRDDYDQMEVEFPGEHKNMLITAKDCEIAILLSDDFFKADYEKIHKVAKQINRDNYAN